jgi:hypothetical protein
MFDELSCRKTFGLVSHKQTEGIEPSRMRERGERQQGCVSGHASKLPDGFPSGNNNRKFPMR